MKVGDMVKMPQDEGYAIVMEMFDNNNHPGQSVKVLRCTPGGPGFDYWDAAACEVIS